MDLRSHPRLHQHQRGLPLLSPHTLDAAVLDLLRRVARDAILPHFGALSTHHIIEKAPDDLVTVADRQAELLLAEGLDRIVPGLAVVGEEGVHADPAGLARLADECWIVDPLDGTHNFAHGRQPFGMLIAMAADGHAHSGWLYDPLADRLCSAHRGRGAFVDGEEISACSTGEEPPVAAISTLFMNAAESAAVTAQVLPHYRLTEIPRCAAEQYPRLALGANDVTIFNRTLAWDHAAGALWLNEAGGRAARPDGSPYRVDEHDRRGLLAAASPKLWDELAERYGGRA